MDTNGAGDAGNRVRALLLLVAGTASGGRAISRLVPLLRRASGDPE